MVQTITTSESGLVAQGNASVRTLMVDRARDMLDIWIDADSPFGRRHDSLAGRRRTNRSARKTASKFSAYSRQLAARLSLGKFGSPISCAAASLLEK
jgi:hypothetical protein